MDQPLVQRPLVVHKGTASGALEGLYWQISKALICQRGLKWTNQLQRKYRRGLHDRIFYILHIRNEVSDVICAMKNANC